MTGPHIPYDWDKADARALQQLSEAKASPAQQRRALNVIIKIAGTYDLSYRPGDPEATAFAEGKRHVGLQIVKLLKIKLGNIPNKEPKK